MLKGILKKKFLVSMTAILTLVIIYFVSNEPESFKQELSYVDSNITVSNIYLLDGYEFVSLASVGVNDSKIEDKAREIIDILIQDGPGESKIPSGFKAIINPDTVLNKLDLEEGILNLDFSKSLFDTKAEYEVKVLECLIYSLTSLDGIKGLKISIEGEPLKMLPSSKIELPEILDKSFGINKDYSVFSLDKVNKVTIYYVNRYNDNYYYVPVTRYLNSQSEKVNLIVDELKDNNYYLTGLMSFMNTNANLIDISLENDEMTLNFDKNFYNDDISKEVFKEVLKSLTLSIEATYGISSVSYVIDNEPLSLD